jgi:hypothetical protein
MCAPGVVCIGPSDTSIIRSSEISYVSPGQTTEVRVNAESKGKDATSMYPSQVLLVPVPGVSSNLTKHCNISCVMQICVFSVR